MSPCHRTLLTALALAAMPWGASAQTLYKSVGADGQIVYSDKPPVTGAVEKTMKLENLPVSVVPGASPAPPATSPDAPQAATPRGDVVLYMATWCGYCKAAKAYLGQKGIAYRELDIDTPAGKAAFAQVGGRGVPVLLAQGQRVTGFTPQAYDAVFVAKK
ncbi:glutaredoxin family protein [Acidovorax sp. FJL06]|uniref:glutaredoxin family protein n=1 Tax=Acidovorax sp. FJL06 TaxID=2153365 RepID=UPI00131577F8|nr:glutaredoxin family protein [Acidovorax sp. FJL06]